MGEEYNLPSGLAGCEWYNEFTGGCEVRVPAKARDRNRALTEALQQLHKMQRDQKDLESLILNLARIVIERPSRAVTEAKSILTQFTVTNVPE